jgi:hypothetical protein
MPSRSTWKPHHMHGANRPERFAQPVVRGRRNFGPVLALILGLGVVGFVAFPYAKPYLGIARENVGAANVANVVLAILPAKSADRSTLDASLRAACAGSLPVPGVGMETWYVCYGRPGQDLIVVRDDGMGRSDVNFVERYVDEARYASGTAGTRNSVFTWPLGVAYTSVDVGGAPYRVVIGWRMNPKAK